MRSGLQSPKTGSICPACENGDHGSANSDAAHRVFKCSCACNANVSEEVRLERCARIAAGRIFSAGQIGVDGIAAIVRETIEMFQKGVQK